MCGIAGIVSLCDKNISSSTITLMTDAIAHRGPDGEGFWMDANSQISLGHKRLSIIDLSNAASQPMHYGERYSIVFNGEIYNYIELKEKLILSGFRFNSESDTEVLLALYSQKGPDCLKDLDGMFAFAVWDSLNKTLFCARDRFGEKPFYYSIHDGYLYFGSEMKALWAAGVPKIVNQEMLYYYLEYSQIHHPYDKSITFYNNIFKLPPSHFFILHNKVGNITLQQYWSLENLQINPPKSENEAKAEFLNLLQTSVGRRLRSDVPVGSSLSGGLDSSAIVCMIDQLKADLPISQNTFSARFPGFKKDEGEYMQYVVKYTNVKPHFTFPDAEGFLNDFDTLFKHQEEPFSSSSIYAQYCVMKLAAENNVIVLLDGQGADEMLAGYPYYYRSYFQELKNSDQEKKRILEMKAYADMQNGNVSIYKDWKNYIFTSFPAVHNVLLNFITFLYSLSKNKYTSSYKNEMSYIKFAPSKYASLAEHLIADITGGNLEDLLRYSDRNSMAHSREVRLPFLSHELCEFVCKLPSEYKIKNGWTKWIQRIALESILPPQITWRKDKIGYEPPQAQWMNSKKIKDLIMNSKEILYDEKIISLQELRKVPGTNSATSKGDKSWNYLMAGMLFR